MFSDVLLLLLLFCCNVPFGQGGDKQKKKRDLFIHAINDDTYETFTSCRRKFPHACSSADEFTEKCRSPVLEKKGTLYSRKWRNSYAIFQREEGNENVGGFGVVAKTFKETKSAGYKKLKHRSHDSYAGLSERKIRQVMSSNIKYRVQNSAFTNKAVSKPVRAQHIQSNTRSIWLTSAWWRPYGRSVAIVVLF